MGFLGESRNLCVEAGCKAACCSNSYPRFNNQKDLLKYFPMALEVSYDELDSIQYPGVFYISLNGAILVRIVYTCPHLNSDYYCALGKNRPPPCKEFIKGIHCSIK